MSVSELMTYNNMILGALGFSGDALNGGSGMVLDPVRFEAWNNLIREFNNRFIKLMDNIMTLVSVKYSKAKLSDDKDRVPVLWMQQLSQLNQGMNLQQRMQLAQSGQIPMDELMFDLGMPSMDLWRSYLLETRLNEESFQIRLAREVTTLQQQEAEKEQQDKSIVEGGNMHIAKQAIIQEAEQFAQELAQQDSSYVRSTLDQLSKEDFVTYAVTVKKLDELRTMQRREAEASMQQ